MDENRVLRKLKIVTVRVLYRLFVWKERSTQINQTLKEEFQSDNSATIFFIAKSNFVEFVAVEYLKMLSENGK